LAEPQRSVAVRKEEESLPTLVSELWEMVVAYAKQETIDPIKATGRFVAVGLMSSVFFALGLTLVGVGGLRAIQAETNRHLRGNLSWLPYLAVAFWALVVAALVATRITKVPSEKER
jgi:ABC-type Mn2+/Zn2+ transport system permease subunit